jgi:hypothetical protein
MQALPVQARRTMGKRNHNQFIKRQKELERQRKASEKMARRKGKIPKSAQDEESVSVEAAPAKAEA